MRERAMVRDGRPKSAEPPKGDCSHEHLPARRRKEDQTDCGEEVDEKDVREGRSISLRRLPPRRFPWLRAKAGDDGRIRNRDGSGSIRYEGGRRESVRCVRDKKPLSFNSECGLARAADSASQGLEIAIVYSGKQNCERFVSTHRKGLSDYGLSASVKKCSAHSSDLY
jgi:hypothetical protein